MKYEMYTPTVNPVWSTPNGDELVAEMARVSVIENKGKPIEKLIQYLMEHNHPSPFQMVNLCVEVFAPRDITRQIIRHSSLNFQEFCIAGDSLISVRGLNSSSRKQRISIADLYARQQSGDYNGRRKGLLARVYDESSKLLVYAPIREVFHTGVKPVYRVSVGNGTQKVLTSTAEHKFLCRDEVFRPLHDIAVGDFVALNGIPVYQSPEWMADAKTRSMEKGIGLAYIAEEVRSIHHTIRWGRVNSIVSAGTVDTYDLEVDHTSHNYVANGIVVHNSGRYSEYPDSHFVLRQPRFQHSKNRQMSIDMDLSCEFDARIHQQFLLDQVVLIDAARDYYRDALNKGIAKEQARCLLPEGNTLSRMYINGTLRSWIHYLQVRTDTGSVQREHVQVADAIQAVFKQQFPIIHKAFFEA